MTQGITLRPYQLEAATAGRDAWAAGHQRIAVVSPTGSGKTTIGSGIVRDWHAAHGPGDRLQRTLWVAHRTELIDDAQGRLRGMLPSHLTVGKVKAEHNQPNASVVVASVQTLLSDRRRASLQNIGLIVIDECHHATSASYRSLIEYFGGYDADSGVKVLGLTATLGVRADGVGHRNVWEHVAWERDILWMIRNGHLVDIEARHLVVDDLDLSGVSTRGSGDKKDFNDNALDAALVDSTAIEVAVKGYLEHGNGQPGIIFAPMVHSARMFAEAFNDSGIPTGLGHGKMSAHDRLELRKDFGSGKLQMLANCGVYTEGFDAPRATVCLLARPTQSQTLFTQMVGRVLRPDPGNPAKTRALLLDLTGTAGGQSLRGLSCLTGGLPIEARPGQTLLEALDAWEDEDGAENGAQLEMQRSMVGKIKATELDLWGGTRPQWLQTFDGHWFLPFPGRYVVVMPNGSGHCVVEFDRQLANQGRWLAQEPTDLGSALALAEEAVTGPERVGWLRRARGTRAEIAKSWHTVELAEIYGRTYLPEAVGRTRGEIADQVAIHQASAVVDPNVRAYLANLQ